VIDVPAVVLRAALPAPATAALAALACRELLLRLVIITTFAFLRYSSKEQAPHHPDLEAEQRPKNFQTEAGWKVLAIENASETRDGATLRKEREDRPRIYVRAAVFHFETGFSQLFPDRNAHRLSPTFYGAGKRVRDSR
jgi:hypothetical protein